MRQLPDFVIAGAQRCGTTSLFNYLSAHPAITPPVAKEVQFFSDNYTRGERWYRSNFPMRGATFDATPYYLFHPLAAERAAATVPDAKVVVLLRNPADRAYSHYRHSVERGHETLSFEDALRAEPARLLGEAERIVAEPGYRSTAHRVFSYAARGRYASQVRAWRDRFGAERVLVLRSEDLYEDPAAQYGVVIDFLGLRPASPPTFIVHARSRPEAGDAAVSASRARLLAEFAADIAELEALLGRRMYWHA